MRKELTLESVSGFKTEDIERIAKDFIKSYKQKTEVILKDIKNSISAVSPQQRGSDRSGSQQKQASKKQQNSATKRDLTQKLIRILMLLFTTFMEVVKVGQFSQQSAYLKQLRTSSTLTNQVLLDLKNFSQSAMLTYQ